MRRVFLIIILTFIAVSAGLVYFNETTIKTVSIISIKRDYARLITSDSESIDFMIYLSTGKSFLSSKQSIESTYLMNQDNQIEVELIDVIDMQDTEVLNGVTYHSFLYRITFSLLTLNDLQFEVATLNITYHKE